jgi:hypothetical protein
MPAIRRFFLLFIEVEGDLGAALYDQIEGNISPISSRQVARWHAALGHTFTGPRVERWVRKELLTSGAPSKSTRESDGCSSTYVRGLEWWMIFH